MDVVERLKQASKLAEEASNDLTVETGKRSDELHALNEKIAKAKVDSAELENRLEEQQAEFDATSSEQAKVLADTKQEIEEKKAEFDRITANVETAKRTHAQFVKYEIEHRKALQAREESLNEREAAIESVIGQMKRRNKIVDEINS